jgi:hypothetical protein
MYSLIARFACARVAKRMHYQMLGHAFTHGVADQFAAEQILQANEVQPAFVGCDVGDVAAPGLIRRGCGEVLVQQMRCQPTGRASNWSSP